MANPPYKESLNLRFLLKVELKSRSWNQEKEKKKITDNNVIDNNDNIITCSVVFDLLILQQMLKTIMAGLI